jgi:hypothetical protein
MQMNLKRFTSTVFLIVALLVTMTVSFVSAQEGTPTRQPDSPEAAINSNYIPIQGRLTDASGDPLNGNFDVSFRLYDVSMGGTSLCEDTRMITVVDGLFSSYMKADSCPIDGRMLYLGMEVESDGEMTPRQFVDNVPYAWSLRPEAKVETDSDNSTLYLNNLGAGEGLWSTSATGEGVHGASGTGAGVAGYGLVGPGVYGESLGGPAIYAGGKLASSEPSYLWISGNGVRPFHHDDSTIIDMNTTGGAKITRGAVTGNKNVMLPITIPGTLYGQNVRLTDLDLYWVGETEFDGITAVLLRRQTGACTSSSCYVTILHNTTSYGCDIGVHPTGCGINFDLSNNNVLSSNSGVLYLTIELTFNSSSSAINIGGVRLTLEYED